MPPDPSHPVNVQLRQLRWRLLNAVDRTRVGQQRKLQLPLGDRVVLGPILFLIRVLLLIAVHLISIRIYLTRSPQTAFNLYARRRGKTYVDSYTVFRRNAQMTLAVVVISLVAMIGGSIAGLTIHQEIANTAPHVFQIGILRPGNLPSPAVAAFKQAMAARGFRDAQTVQYQELTNAVSTAALEVQAEDFVRQRKDLIVALGDQAAMAAKVATLKDHIPVLFLTSFDPVQEGLIQSYTNSGNNLVGVGQAGLIGRQLDLMKKVLPQMHTLGILSSPGDETNQTFVDAVRQGATQRGLVPLIVTIATVKDIGKAMDEIAAQPNSAVYLTVDVFSSQNIDRIAQAATDRKLFSMGTVATNVQAGATAALYSDLNAIGQQLAQMADQIFSGSHSSDLSSAFAGAGFLAINRKTAAAIGLVFPADVIAQADVVY